MSPNSPRRLTRYALFALMSCPLMAQFPNAAQLDNLGPKTTQQVLKTAFTTTHCDGVSCDAPVPVGPDYHPVAAGASGGNRFDPQGVVFTGIAVLPPNTTNSLLYVKQIWKINTNGDGSLFGVTPLYTGVYHCSQPTNQQFVASYTDTLDFSFNQHENALFVSTVAVNVVFNLPAGSTLLCGPAGYSIQGSNTGPFPYTINSTYALLELKE